MGNVSQCGTDGVDDIWKFGEHNFTGKFWFFTGKCILDIKAHSLIAGECVENAEIAY